jgi:hypothetical protein
MAMIMPPKISQMRFPSIFIDIYLCLLKDDSFVFRVFN